MNPNATTPPNTPSSTRTKGRSLPWLMIIGLMTLSTAETTSRPHRKRKMPHPVSPFVNRMMLAGIQTSGGPTGTGDRKNVTRPSNGAALTPAIHSPIAIKTPCASAVPRMP